MSYVDWISEQDPQFCIFKRVVYQCKPFTNTLVSFNLWVQLSILLTYCCWIPNYPRVFNFWLISHRLVLVFLDTCFFQLHDSYEFWDLYYWQMRRLRTEGMRERYLAVQHCNIQSCSYRVKARAEIKRSRILVEQHHPPQAFSAIAGRRAPLSDDVTHCDELWNVSHSIKLSSLSFNSFICISGLWVGHSCYVVHFTLKINKVVLQFQEECLLNYNFIIYTMSR